MVFRSLSECIKDKSFQLGVDMQKSTSLIPPSVAEAAKKGQDFLFQNSGFLIAGTVAALIWAIYDYDYYHQLMHSDLVNTSNAHHGEHSTGAHFNFHFLVNDILMCFFFAIAAKEIWEALLPGGALSSPRKAATPLIATVGGIAGPAGLYVGLALFFGAQEAVRGWAIPCATDIAFSYLIARLIFGKDHPAIPFLLLLAVADDAAGLIILAVFYPSKAIDLPAFLGYVIGAISFNLIVLRQFKVKNFWAYLAVAGPLSWWGFYQGGIHPALALVPIIPTLPHADKDEGLFAEHHKNDPLNAFEHWWKRPVELILMLFGLANAGVVFSNMESTTWFVTSGLLIGKPVGILLCTWVAVKLFKLTLPDGMNLGDVLVLGCMAGIGFTVALFVSTVAFPPGATQDAAKMGALFSFAAAGIAFVAAKITGVVKVDYTASPKPQPDLLPKLADAE